MLSQLRFNASICPANQFDIGQLSSQLAKLSAQGID